MLFGWLRRPRLPLWKIQFDLGDRVLVVDSPAFRAPTRSEARARFKAWLGRPGRPLPPGARVFRSA